MKKNKYRFTNDEFGFGNQGPSTKDGKSFRDFSSML